MWANGTKSVLNDLSFRSVLLIFLNRTDVALKSINLKVGICMIWVALKWYEDKTEWAWMIWLYALLRVFWKCLKNFGRPFKYHCKGSKTFCQWSCFSSIKTYDTGSILRSNSILALEDELKTRSIETRLWRAKVAFIMWCFW